MKIVNLARLKMKLRRMSPVAKDEIRKAMEQSANEVVDLMKRIVPVDRGDLRDSIGWTYGAPPKGSFSIGRSSRRSALGKEGLVITIFAGGNEAFHARWIEFGTQAMNAQPYFFPSFRLMKKRAKSRISRATTKAAKRVAAGR